METELKFQVPPARRDALWRAVATSTAQRTRLQAVYFDTAGLALAQAGLALRLRKEGRVWVQTLKGRAGVMSRTEHEVRLPAQAGVPALDVQRHAGSPAGDALSAVLAQADGPLQPLYRTDIQRLHRLVRHEGATVELACDRGWLLAGERRLAVHEIEFELKSGPPEALVALARRWVARFGLWWDVRTKAEQGVRLARALDTVPAIKAQAPDGAAVNTPGDVFRNALQASLLQALANAAELADGRGAPEHLHQLRVGLRRLRTVLRLFAPWSADEAAARALEADWRAPFGALGAARDGDVLATTWQARLRQAGAPDFAWPPAAPGVPAAEQVRAAAFTDLLLRSLAWSLPAPASAGTPTAAEAARRLLRPAWRRLLRDAAAFADADGDARHRTRKRLKRFRYALEFLLPLYPAKPSRRLLRNIGAALSALGELHDVEMALPVLRAHAASEPAAWFAVGWMSSQQALLVQRSGQCLQALQDAPRVWRR